MFDIKLTTLFLMCCLLSGYVSSAKTTTKRSDGLLSDIVSLLVKEKFEREKMMKELRNRDKEMNKMFNTYRNFESKYKMLFKKLQKIQDRHQTIGYTGGLPNNSPNFPRGSTIKFSRVISKFGKGYDTKNGVFTCIYPGTYLIDVSLSTKTCEWSHAFLVKNHRNFVRLYTGENQKYNYPSGSMAFLISLKKGDQIWIKSWGNCHWYADSYLTILRV